MTKTTKSQVVVRVQNSSTKTVNMRDLKIGMVFTGTVRGFKDSGNLFSICGSRGNGAIFSIDKPGRWFSTNSNYPIDNFQLVDMDITLILK